jgi:hypothetical protein
MRTGVGPVQLLGDNDPPSLLPPAQLLSPLKAKSEALCQAPVKPHTDLQPTEIEGCKALQPHAPHSSRNSHVLIQDRHGQAHNRLCPCGHKVTVSTPFPSEDRSSGATCPLSPPLVPYGDMLRNPKTAVPRASLLDPPTLQGRPHGVSVSGQSLLALDSPEMWQSRKEKRCSRGYT